jgi:hypothetical protein
MKNKLACKFTGHSIINHYDLLLHSLYYECENCGETHDSGYGFSFTFPRFWYEQGGTVLATIIILFILFLCFYIPITLDSLSCKSIVEKMGLAYDYKVFTGCMVNYHSQWYQLNMLKGIIK